jgi:hypothetical protein
MTRLGTSGLSCPNEGSSRTALHVEEMGVPRWIGGINLPIKHLGVEGAESCGIGCRNFYVTNWMI